MEPAAMLAQLAADGAALRAAATDLDKPVPSCPGWTVRDVVEHTAVVYAHKSTVIEGSLDRPPAQWPPKFRYDDVREFYDEQLHRVIEALRTRDPATAVWTWYEPEQTVGFWVRRMMQETVVHRADVESAFGPPSAPPAEVAVDGIDEFVERMLCDDIDAYAEAAGTGQRLVIAAGPANWTVTLGSDAATFVRNAAADVDARLEGEPGAVLLALWNRLPYAALDTSGDAAALAALRAAAAATTQ
jgi:uncharacterized protein (TIGR03083 family)